MELIDKYRSSRIPEYITFEVSSGLSTIHSKDFAEYFGSVYTLYITLRIIFIHWRIFELFC